jgi:hypothetical protein
MLNLVQIVLQSLVFHYNLGILTVIWTILYMNLTPFVGSRNPTNLSSQTRSFHWLMGPYFLQKIMFEHFYFSVGDVFIHENILLPVTIHGHSPSEV